MGGVVEDDKGTLILPFKPEQMILAWGFSSSV